MEVNDNVSVSLFTDELLLVFTLSVMACSEGKACRVTSTVIHLTCLFFGGGGDGVQFAALIL
jgi:hypothetical protein